MFNETSKKVCSLLAIIAVVLSAVVACAAPAAAPATTAAKTTAAPAATTAAAAAAATTSAAATTTAAATSAAAPAATTAAAPAAAVNPVSLKVALMTNKTGRGEAIQWWADEVTKRTGGKVKFELFWAESMLKGTAILDGVKTGLADLGEVADSFHPDRMPLNQIDLLPFGTGDALAILKVMDKMRETLPELRKEVEQNQVILLTQSSEDVGIVLAKPLRTLAELRGAKIRTYGNMPALVSAVGMVPVSMASTEAYEALQRGTVVGGLSTLEMVYRYKWFENARFFSEWNLGTTQAVHVTINADVWNKLPKDVQQTMLAVGQEQQKVVADIFNRDSAGRLETMKKQVGFEIMPVSDADRATLNKAGEAIWDKFAKDMDAKGLPGTKAVETFRTLLKGA